MKKHWITLSLVAMIILGAVVAAFFLSKPQGNTIMASVNMAAVQESGQGVALDTGFTITTGYGVSEEELRAMLTVEPEIGDFAVSGSGKDWTLIPEKPLEKNTVYTFGIRNSSGEVVQSFAFQTKSDLLINTVFPQDGAQYVDQTTGIEINFNATDVDLRNFFEVKPEIPGTFETSGYTAIFKPDTPLALDNIYRVTIKAGLAAPNGMTLAEDYTFSFETNSQESSKWDYTQLSLSGSYAETFLTGDPLAVQLSSGSDVKGQKYDVKIHKYADINDYINELKAHDTYYRERYGRKTEYVADTKGLEEISSFNGPLFQQGEYWGNLYAILPENLPEGHYIVTISGKDTQGNDQFVQKLIQIRNLSVYTQSTDGDTLVWLNDANAGEPMSDRLLYLTDAEKQDDVRQATTQADGTARVITGKMENAYISVMESGKVTYFEPVSLSQQKQAQINEQYYAALYTDREIYQPDDTIRFWGVVKPRRATSTMPQNIWAQLNGEDPQNPLYRAKLEIKADGTFEGQISVSSMKKNWYSLVLTNGETGENAWAYYYTEKSIPIEEYTKPPYVITLEPDKDQYFADETIKVNVNAKFFDGTPVAGGNLRISSSSLLLNGSTTVEDGNISLDAQGNASFTAKYQDIARMASSEDEVYPSWCPTSLWYSVSNADAEDVSVSQHGTITVLPSRIAAKIEEGSTPGELKISTAQLDASKVKDPPAVSPFRVYSTEFDRLKGAAVDMTGSLLVHQTEYKQIPTGSYYDYVNKKTMTQYKVERVETLLKTVPVKTENGAAVIKDLPYEEIGADKIYWYELRFDGGTLGTVRETFYRFDPYGERRVGTDQYSFRAGERYEAATAALGEEITLSLYRNGVKEENKGAILFAAGQRKMLDFDIFRTSEKKITMDEEFLPNVWFGGAYFDGRHVYKIDPMTVNYNYDSQKLKIDVKADKETYKPGEQASVTLTVTDAQGKPVTGTACVGVVDEAVFALREQTVDLAGQLYKQVFYADLNQSASYKEYKLEMASADMGGYGGGGPDGAPLRANFVDTALFQTVQLGADGKASVKLTLPDNVTAWRVTAAAVSADLKAGDNLATTAATLPFYLRPLFTDNYLVGDDISVSVDGVGTALKAEDSIEYTAVVSDAEGKQVAEKKLTGKAGERAAFNFGKLEAGSYSLTVSGKAGENGDAVKQEFSVVKKGLTVPAYQDMTLDELVSIDSVRYPVQITIYDEKLEPYMTAMEMLAGQNGERTEIIAAAYRARVLSNELLAPEEREKIPRDSRLDEFQKYDEGVRILPVSEADAAVTAKMLVAAPELVSFSSAETFLQKVLKDAASTPDDRVMAYVGLAAMKKPVLLDIERLAADETLTVAQKLYLGVGLAKLGDFTGAQKLYDGLGKSLITEGKIKYVEAGGTLEEQLQNTAAALMLTSIISNPDADALMGYFNSIDTDRAKTDKVLFNLEVLTYLENFSMPEGADTSRFSCTLNGETQEFELKEKGCKALSLTAEGLRGANFKAVAGKLRASVRYTDYAADLPASADGANVKIEKTYTPVSGGMTVNQRIKVELKVKFDPSAPSGCYTISDYIPSGMRYMESSADSGLLNPRTDWLWSFLENEDQRVQGFIYRSKDVKPLDGDMEAKDAEAGTALMYPEVSENRDEYTLTYFVSGALAGEFVNESAYITPNAGGASVGTPRGTIKIAQK